MFTTVFTLLFAIAIVASIGAITHITSQMKWFYKLFTPICACLALICLIGILALGICLLHNWGNITLIQQWMAGLGLAGIVFGVMIGIDYMIDILS